MQRYIAVIVLCLSGGLFVSPTPSASSQKNSDSAAELVDVLDDCMQQRFLDVDKGFGVRRLIRPADTAHRFKPENAKELAVVDYLSGSRLDVVLFLAGRAIVGAELDTEEPDSAAARLIKGPVVITTSDKQIGGLPPLKQILDRSQQAMRVFQGSNKYDFNLGEWRFIARPVRASAASCLNCHQGNSTKRFPTTNNVDESKSLKIGDPLGVIVYGYKQS